MCLFCKAQGRQLKTLTLSQAREMEKRAMWDAAFEEIERPTTEEARIYIGLVLDRRPIGEY